MPLYGGLNALRAILTVPGVQEQEQGKEQERQRNEPGLHAISTVAGQAKHGKERRVLPG